MIRSSLLLVLGFVGALLAGGISAQTMVVHETSVGGTVITDNEAVGGARAMGSVAVASGSVTLDIFIENTAAPDLTPTNLQVTSGGADFSVSGTLTNPLPSGNSTSFTITFDPATVGAKTGTITFDHNNGGSAGTFTINVSGTGTNTAPVLAAPTSGGITIGGSDPAFTGTITVGGNLAVSFDATDADTADTLSFTISVTGGSLTGAQAGFAETFPFTPAGGTSPETANLTGTAANAGTITLTISVSDGTVADQYTLAITINAANNPPVLAAPTSGGITIGGSDPNFTGTITVGGNLAVAFDATDADAGDTLTFTISVTGGSLTGAQAGFAETFPFSPAGGTSPETANLTGTAANAGTITLTISVGDGTVTDQYTLAITINAANSAPVMAAPTSGGISIGGSDPNFTGTITVGGNLAVSFDATDADAGDTLTFTISVTGGSLTGAQAGFAETFPFSPAGGTSPETANLTGSAANAGTITLTISVSDGTVTDQYTLAITINAGNSPPVLSAPTSGGITIGGSDPNFTGSIAVSGNLAVSFSATDANAGDTLTFTISVTGGTLTGAQAGFAQTFPFSPAGGTSPETANLTGTAANTGTITLTISVSDGTVTDQYTLAITISAGNSAPVLAAPSSAGITISGTDPNFTGSINTTGSLAVSFTATDANAGDTLTFTISVTGGTLTGAQAGFAQTFPFSPAGGTSPETANLTGTAANAGTITLTISVSDGTVTDQYTLAITISVASPASITVLSPNGGESRVINSGALITWTNGGGFTGNVDILLSTDGGGTFPNTVVSNFANNGFFNWTVPNLPTATARIRVRATGTGTPADDSNANFTIVAGTLGGAIGNAGGVDGAQTTTPGKSADGLHFQVANDAQSPAALTITSIRVAIATNDNASNLAISHLAGVRLQNGNGTTVATVLNGGTGWSVAGTTITVTFGSVTPLAFNVPVGGALDFWVELAFTNVTVIGIPTPVFACSIDNTAGTALNGGGTTNYPGVVAGGSITLASSIPGDDFDDTDNSNGTFSCSPAESGSNSLTLLALLATLGLALAVRRRSSAAGSR